MQEDKTAMDLAEENTEIMKILSEQQTKKGPKISIPWIKSDIVRLETKSQSECVYVWECVWMGWVCTN